MKRHIFKSVSNKLETVRDYMRFMYFGKFCETEKSRLLKMKINTKLNKK